VTEYGEKAVGEGIETSKSAFVGSRVPTGKFILGARYTLQKLRRRQRATVRGKAQERSEPFSKAFFKRES